MLKVIKIRTMVVWVITLDSCQHFEEAFCLHLIDANCTVETKAVKKWS